MPSHTIDAALEADASCTFPVVFPFNFGPGAAAARGAGTDSSQSIIASTTEVLNVTTVLAMAEAITASAASSAACHYYADASLPCTVTTPANFTPLVTADAALAVTASMASTAGRNAEVDAAQSITASTSTVVGATWLVAANIAITDTASTDLRRHRKADASLQATANFLATAKSGAAANASLPIVFSNTLNIGNAFFADAEIIISSYSTFPYVFPFVFEQSFDTISRGQSINATKNINAAAVASGVRGVIAHAEQDVLAAFFVACISGGEHPGDVAFTATATAAATMSQGHVSAAALAATATPAAHLAATLHANAHQNASLTPAAITHWQVRVSTALHATAGIGSAGSVQGRLNAHASALVGFLVAQVRHQYADAALMAHATTGISQFHDVTMDARLAVRATTTATFPEPTGFWDFFLR